MPRLAAALFALPVLVLVACAGSDSGGEAACTGATCTNGVSTGGTTGSGGQGGVKSTAGSAGSTAKAGSSSGGTSQSGGGGVFGGGGAAGDGAGGSPALGACSPQLGASACVSCCATEHAAGRKVYSQDVSVCACQGACKTACSAECKAGGTVGQGCGACLDGAFSSGQCNFTQCNADGDCKAYGACLDGCSGGGQAGGGQAGGGQAGGAQAGSGQAGGSSGDPLEQARVLCVEEINKHRATIGLGPLKRWTAAESCSDMEAQSDSMTGKAHGAFGKCGEWAQNECPGWPGPPVAQLPGCLQMMWDEGPENGDGKQHGHYINMTNKQYTQVACGFSSATGSWWGVQNFQ